MKLPYSESPKSQKTINEAKKLMAEAGLAGGFSFEMISSIGFLKDTAQLVQGQIAKVFPNIKISLTPLDNAIQLKRAAKGDFEAQAYCYIHEPTAVGMMRTVFHSKGGRNLARYNTPKMDDLIDRAGRELDTAKRKELLRQAQLLAYNEVPMIVVGHYSSVTAIQAEVRGYRLGGATNHPMFGKD